MSAVLLPISSSLVNALGRNPRQRSSPTVSGPSIATSPTSRTSPSTCSTRPAPPPSISTPKVCSPFANCPSHCPRSSNWTWRCRTPSSGSRVESRRSWSWSSANCPWTGNDWSTSTRSKWRVRWNIVWSRRSWPRTNERNRKRCWSSSPSVFRRWSSVWASAVSSSSSVAARRTNNNDERWSTKNALLTRSSPIRTGKVRFCERWDDKDRSPSFSSVQRTSHRRSLFSLSVNVEVFFRQSWIGRVIAARRPGEKEWMFLLISLVRSIEAKWKNFSGSWSSDTSTNSRPSICSTRPSSAKTSAGRSRKRWKVFGTRVTSTSFKCYSARRTSCCSLVDACGTSNAIIAPPMFIPMRRSSVRALFGHWPIPKTTEGQRRSAWTPRGEKKTTGRNCSENEWRRRRRRLAQTVEEFLAVLLQKMEILAVVIIPLLHAFLILTKLLFPAKFVFTDIR